MSAPLPSMTELLGSPGVQGWLSEHPRQVVTASLRFALEQAREVFRSTGKHSSVQEVLAEAGEHLRIAGSPRIREAINATGIILHTGLGRAVFSETVVDSIVPALKSSCTLAIDVQTGERAERDVLIEYLLSELTGAEAATVVNNNAAATILTLAALASGKEVLVSRGQLIEIGGSFRLPDVMAQSGARLVEVGATNRTHLKDYERAITPETAALMRVHPSNYRIEGFTSEVSTAEMAAIARKHNVLMIDDLGAGALLPLENFGLPHEPTASESVKAGADLVLFSGDKLVGASQAGIILGKRSLIQRLRSHPLMRALRPDKTCLLVLERTLQLFRDPALVKAKIPTYQMICTPKEDLVKRGEELMRLLADRKDVSVAIEESEAFLGSGSLPTQGIPSVCVTVRVEGLSPDALLLKLRTGDPAIFGRIEEDVVRLDMRTVTDRQVPVIARAL